MKESALAQLAADDAGLEPATAQPARDDSFDVV